MINQRVPRYRAWDLKRNKLYEKVINIDLFEGGQIVLGGADIEDETEIYLNDVILMPYMNIDDINGKPIFEHDLIKQTFYDYEDKPENIIVSNVSYYIIAWVENKKGYVMLEPEQYKKATSPDFYIGEDDIYADLWSSDSRIHGCGSTYEVLGCVISNPKLLEADLKTIFY